jgi:acetyl esterase
MPLHPQARKLLDAMAALGAPPLSSVDAATARKMMEAAPRPPGAAMHINDTRLIPGPAGDIPVRVYTPYGVAGRGPVPVIVYFHGGGWVIGSLASHDGTCRNLAQASGCIVVAVDYRLAPETRYPGAVEDAVAATRWVAEHARSFGGDPARLAVAGDSAGGNLAAVVALVAKAEGGPAIGFQALVYPVTDFNFDTPSYSENAEGYLLSKASMEWFWGHYLGEDTSRGLEPHASPLRAESLEGLPPALVITAEFDPLRDEGNAYARRLADAGVPVEHKEWPGQIHGFFGNPALDDGQLAIEHVARAIRDAFGMGQ